MNLRNRYISLIFALLLALNGCRNFEQVKLTQCNTYNADDIKWFQRKAIESGVLRYSFNKGKSSFSFTGIIDKQADSVVMAAMSDVGVTLFAARWTKSSCKLIMNNTSMPDSFLINGILADIMVSLTPISANGNILCDIESGGGWLGIESEYLDRPLYYVTGKDKPALLELESGKIVYEISCESRGDGQVNYHIENGVYGYRSDIRY